MFHFQAIKYLERMLIQAYCQQEREKRCTITANTAESNSNERNESNAERMDTDESESTDQADGTKTPKAEPNASPTPNDVEMTGVIEPATKIKQEPEDEISVEMDPLADESTEDSSSKNDEKSDSQPEIQAVKTETAENEDEGTKESSRDNPSDSTDKPIKIEESVADKDDPYSKDINIDPRTYCKLGHFHLLLEDYAKGMSVGMIERFILGFESYSSIFG